MCEYVEDGIVMLFVLWNLVDFGYLLVFVVKVFIEGDIIGVEGDIFEVGDFGEYMVGVDGVVVFGDLFVFDVDNIGDFDF